MVLKFRQEAFGVIGTDEATPTVTVIHHQAAAETWGPLGFGEGGCEVFTITLPPPVRGPQLFRSSRAVGICDAGRG